MTKSEYSELVEFLGRRFDGLETRLTRVEVGMEAMRDDIRQLAEGLVATNERIDRIEGRLERLDSRLERFEIRFIHLENRFDGFEGRFDRFDADFRADRLDVLRRLKALEN